MFDNDKYHKGKRVTTQREVRTRGSTFNRTFREVLLESVTRVLRSRGCTGRNLYRQGEEHKWKPEEISCIEQWRNKEKSWSIRTWEESRWQRIWRGEQASDQEAPPWKGKESAFEVEWEGIWRRSKRVSDVTQSKTSLLRGDGTMIRARVVKAGDQLGGTCLSPDER